MNKAAIYIAILIFSMFIAWLIFWLLTNERTGAWIRKYSGMQSSGVNQASSALLVLSVAFILNDVGQIRSKASDVLLQEADVLRTMGRISVNLRHDLGEPLQGMLTAYAEATLNVDWPQMEKGTGGHLTASQGSLAHAIQISDFLFSKLDDIGHPMLSSQLVHGVQQLRALRLQRIELSVKHPSFEKVALSLFFCLIAICVLTLTHGEKPRALRASVFLFSWLTMTTLYAILNMHNPYVGISPVTNAPIASAFDRLKVMSRASETIYTGAPAPEAQPRR